VYTVIDVLRGIRVPKRPAVCDRMTNELLLESLRLLYGGLPRIVEMLFMAKSRGRLRRPEGAAEVWFMQST
jgi:hypothetical protein